MRCNRGGKMKGGRTKQKGRRLRGKEGNKGAWDEGSRERCRVRGEDNVEKGNRGRKWKQGKYVQGNG